MTQLIFICHNVVIELLKWVGKKVKLNFNMSMGTAVNTGRHPFAHRCFVQETSTAVEMFRAGDERKYDSMDFQLSHFN